MAKESLTQLLPLEASASTDALPGQGLAPHAADDLGADPSWGFAISFIGGHGVLSTRDRFVGPVGVKHMALEVPNLVFPFDLSGGAEIFRSRRCLLRQLVLTLDNARLLELVHSVNLAAHGLSDLKVAILDGYLELAGTFRVGDQQSDFTCRASLLPSGPHAVRLIFYETRLFSWLPVPAPLLPVCLQRAFNAEGAHVDLCAGAWTLRPVESFARRVMPRGGWKIPDLSRSHLLGVQISRGELTLSAGPGEASWDQTASDRPPPPAALRAARGILRFEAAERALAAGAIGEAYQMFRRGADDPQDGAWARDRLLQIGVADPELLMETRRLAEEVLAHNPDDVTARLVLGAQALRRRAYPEAVDHYQGLSELLGARKERFDVVAAEMAAGRAAAFTNPEAALRAFERAASRAHDNPTIQAHIYALHESTGAYAAAAEAGERWVELVVQAQERGTTRCRLAHLYLTKLRDSDRARHHFLAALREVPEMPEALEGLAEAHIARDEPEQATDYLERMAEQAETCEDSGRIALLNMRLGEVSRRWLKDMDAAAARFRRVLDVEPRHVQARLRLAELCEEKDDLVGALELYRGVVLVQEDMVAGDAQDVLTAHLRLADLFERQSPDKGAQIIAQLERVLELDPHHQEASDKLLARLRLSQDWAPLVLRLEALVDRTADPLVARAARLEAAQVEIFRRQHPAGARRFVDPLLDAEPAATDALDLLSEICRQQKDFHTLAQRLTAAIGGVPRSASKQRAALLYQLGLAQKGQGIEPKLCAQSLEAALLLDPEHAAAATLLVDLLEKTDDVAAQARAYKQLAATHTEPELQARALLAAARAQAQLPGGTGSALATAQAALRVLPTHLDAHLLHAQLQAEADPDGAIATLQAALEHFDGASAAALHAELARLCHAVGDSVGEVDQYAALETANALTPEQHHLFVDALLVLGQEARAAALWQRLASRQQDAQARGKALLQAASLQITAGHLAGARDLLQQICELPGRLAVSAAEQLEALCRSEADAAGIAWALAKQIEQSPPQAQLAPYQRLLEHHLEGGASAAAATVAREVLDRSPQHPLARHTLAQHACAEARWEVALDHAVYLTLVSPADALPAALRQEDYRCAAAIAQEIRVNALPALEEGFFGEFGMKLTVPPMGEQLAQAEAWEPLLALRQLQLSMPNAANALWLRRQLAEILHLRLGRVAEAEPHYLAVSLAEPTDVVVRLALVDIFAADDRPAERAAMHNELSQLAQEPEMAAKHALAAAELYAGPLGAASAAEGVISALLQQPQLRALCSRALCPAQASPPALRKLPMMLRNLGLHQELAGLLEASLQLQPSADDGRFEELFSLLRGPLGQPSRALQLTSALIAEVPQDDSLRRKELALYAQHGAQANVPDLSRADAGQQAAAVQMRVQAYTQWAEARTAAPRAAILQELAQLFLAQGNPKAALGSLAAAAEAHPKPAFLYEEIIAEALRAELWEEAIVWLWRVVRQPGRHDAKRVAQNDARLLQIVRLATENHPHHASVRSALCALSCRNPEQLGMLLRLSQADNDYRELLQPQVVQSCTDAQLFDTAVSLGTAGALAAAQTFLQTLLSRHSGPGGLVQEVWDLAERTWRRQDRLAELAHWRLEWAATAGSALAASERRRLQLLAYTELLEVDKAPEGVDVPKQIRGVLAEVDYAYEGEAHAAFLAARAIDAAGPIAQAAAALEDLLPPGDARLPEVLRARLAHELDLPADAVDLQPAVAVGLARRLISLGDAAAHAALETALERAGQRGELLELLTHRARQSAEPVPELWTRIAGLHCALRDFQEAAVALGQVVTEDRSKAYGELQYAVGGALQDSSLRLSGSGLCAQYSFEPHERAAWLRRAAQVRWHEMNDPRGALALLQEGHHLQPVDPAQALRQAGDASALAAADAAPSEASAGAPDEAFEPKAAAQRAILQAALAVLPPAQTAALWRRLGELLLPEPQAVGSARATYDEALQCLTLAAHLAAPDDVRELQQLVDLAAQQQAEELHLLALRRLDAHDPVAHVEALASALDQYGHVGPLVDLLVQHADQATEPAVAAEFFERAAELTQTRLHQRDASLALWQRACAAAPTQPRLLEALRLAEAALAHPTVVSLGSQLRQLLPQQDPNQEWLLRLMLASYADLEDAAGQIEVRRALVTSGLADLQDRQILAEAQLEADPQYAAQLWDEVAEAHAAAGNRQAQWAQALFFAAQAHARTADPEPAAARLRMALAAGNDDPRAYQLAMQVFDAPARLPILGRFLALQGDLGLPLAQRASLRLELARAKLASKDPGAAQELVQEACALDATPVAVHFLEEILIQRGDGPGLLDLYLRRTQADLWPGAAYVDRLRRAIELAQQQAAPADELLALDRLAEASSARFDSLVDPQQAAGLVQEADWLRMLELCGSLDLTQRFIDLLAQLRGRTHALDATTALARAAAPWCLRLKQDAAAAVQAARELLEAALAKQEDADLLDLLKQTYARDDRLLDFAHYLQARARQRPGSAVDWRLLAQSAELLQAHGAPQEAFGLFGEMQQARGILPEEALRFSVRHAVQEGLYDAAVSMLVQQAEHVDEPTVAHEQLLMAASIVRDKFGDEAKELELLHAAYDKAPHAALLGRLVEFYLRRGEPQTAADLLRNVDLQQQPEALASYKLLFDTAPSHLDDPLLAGLLQALRDHGEHQALADLCLFLAGRAVAEDREGHTAYVSEAATQYRDHLQDPGRAAALFERAGDAAAAYAIYSQLMETQGPEPGLRGSHAMHAGRLALELGDAQAAGSALAVAYRLRPQDGTCRELLRQALGRAERHHELAEFLSQEAKLAERAGDRVRQHAELVQLADVHGGPLGRPTKAAQILEKALQALPGSVSTLERLIAHYEGAGDTARYLLTAERLLGLQRQAPRSADFYARLGHMYQEVDPSRAKALLAKAASVRGDAPAPATTSANSAADQPVAAAPPQGSSSKPSPSSRKVRPEELESLTATLEAEPSNTSLMRRLADIYAMQPQTWSQATELYSRLLQHQPQDVDTCKILARLHGQAGHTDAAYSLYACLLAVDGADLEAQRFVQACRAASQPQPAGVDLSPRAYVELTQHLADLVLPAHAQPLVGDERIEKLFAPLARYAELVLPGNRLSDAELAQQPQIDAGDGRLAELGTLIRQLPGRRLQAKTHVEAVVSEMHLAPGTPTLLVGSELFGSLADTQQGSNGKHQSICFLLARSIELYRSGHTLCARLPVAELEALGYALDRAVDNSPIPLPLGADTQAFTSRIAPLLSPHIRQVMRPLGKAFRQADDIDFAAWARRSVCAANRLALLWCSDVQAAVEGLRALHAQLPQAASLACGEAEQVMDLLLFAQSAAYFELRAELGIALPT